MTEGPLLENSISKRLLRFPLKSLFFITIKDNTQKSRWVKIGKISDWIRRYSDDFVIVRGMEGGIHFHLLAGIRKNANIRYQKGIHFLSKDMTNNTCSTNSYDASVAYDNFQGRCKYDAIRESKLMNKTCEVLEPYQQELLLTICSSIREYHNRIKKKKAASIAKNKKHKDILNIIDYLYKNLNETRENAITQYVDYIVRINNVNRHN